jgi:hypothetical protein
MLKPDIAEGKVVTTLWEQKETNSVGIHLNSLVDLGILKDQLSLKLVYPLKACSPKRNNTCLITATQASNLQEALKMMIVEIFPKLNSFKMARLPFKELFLKVIHIRIMRVNRLNYNFRDKHLATNTYSNVKLK